MFFVLGGPVQSYLGEILTNFAPTSGKINIESHDMPLPLDPKTHEKWRFESPNYMGEKTCYNP